MSISNPPRLESGTFCQDVMVEIFLRSPVKSLKRLFFVSKNWGDFLSHPNFNQLYMKRNPRRQDLVFPARFGRRELVVLNKTHPPVGAFSVHNLPLECKEKLLVGSCGGLLCFTRHKNVNGKKGFIWNPVTKVGKLFDFPPLLPTEIKEFEVSGFGYDVKNQDYKVVRLVGCKYESRIQLYSSRQDSWRDIRTVPFSTSVESIFVIEGVPYWVGKQGAEGQTSVLFSFDPTTELHSLISLPAVDQSRSVYVVSSGYEILALAHSKDDATVDVYRSQNETWVLMFRTGPVDNLYGEKIIHYFRNSMVTWSVSNTILYDVEKEEVLPISSMIQRLIPRMDESYFYLETLVGVTGGQTFYPKSVGEVFRDFKGRRVALIKALTIDAEKFYKQCEDHEEGVMQCDQVCLYGLTNEEWEVRLGSFQFSDEHPEPGRGIYFAQKAMEENVWLSFVAARCDEWLLSVAFFFGAQLGFDKDDRNRLFSLINDLPTVYEVVRAAPKKQLKQNLLQQQ